MLTEFSRYPAMEACQSDDRIEFGRGAGQPTLGVSHSTNFAFEGPGKPRVLYLGR